MSKKLELWQRIDRLALEAEKLSREAARVMLIRTAEEVYSAHVVLRSAANRCGQNEDRS